MKIARKSTVKCFIGDTIIGGESDISIQSMTNSTTGDVERTVAQCKEIFNEGADYVRIAVPSMNDIDAIREISRQLNGAGIYNPLIADVHFNPKIAKALTSVVDKIRINPGNFTNETDFLDKKYEKEEYEKSLEETRSRVKPLIENCLRHGTAIRIGINHGSLSQRIISKFGNSPEAMANSAIEWIAICESYDFTNLVLSLKASNVHFMLESYFHLEKLMEARGKHYPLHIGVTEAGNGLEGRAKSAAGIGALLLQGLGDTIRVSLTENPVNEIIFGKKIVAAVEDIQPDFYTIDENRTLFYTHHEPDREKFIAEVAAISSYEHYKRALNDLKIANRFLSTAEIENMEKIVLQAVGIKIFFAEFISCPSCSRTQFDIEKVTAHVKEKFSSFRGVKIGIMGCVVNGPGEMADAHYGIVGYGKDRAAVYKGKQAISKSLPMEEALQLLEKKILLEKKNFGGEF